MLGKELDSGHDDPDLESGLPCDDGDEQPAQGRALRRSGSHLLSSVPRHARITVECVGLRAFVPVLVAPTKEAKVSSEAPKKGKTEQPKERQVLFDVSACVEPGEMLALMGPSGSGKSSLLTLLGGRSTARLEGSITFNGNRLGKAAKRKLGYVSQDDLLYAELTVYETLYFAAMLRLPRTWSHEAKLQRVQMVLAGLGLDKCRDTIIGNHMMRGVSGGERKRVSIGHELLINPSVIFLDEPTSGLDSTTALKLMHTLRSLASGGRTIITSIHQPSSRLYQQVDKLLLLAEGHTLYYGDAHVCAHWFGSLGQPVPFGVSTSDHVLDLACGDLPGRSREESQDILTYLTTSFRERKIGHGRHGILAEHLGREAILASATSRRDRLAALHFPASPSPFPDSGVPTTSGPPSEAQGDENMHLGFPATLAKSAPAGSTATSGDGKDRERGGAAAEATRRADVCGAGPGRQSTLGLDSEASSPPRVAPRMNIQMSAAGAKEGATGKGIGSDLDVGLRRLASSSSGSPKKEQEQQQGEGDQEGKWGATWLDQVKYLTQRSLKTRRFSALSIQRMIECIVVGVLAGLFWFQAGAGDMDKQRVLDIGGLLFFEILFLSFSSLFQAIFNYPPEFLMLVKERQSGMYRLSAYYVARSLADLPMDCALPSILTWIMYWMAGLRISAAAFFANWGAVLLTVMLAQSIGLLIGATINNLKTCLTAATIIMLSIMLVGGYYVRGIPVWIAWLKYLSFIYYSWNLILHIEFNNRPMTPDSCIPASGSCTVGKAGVFDNDVDAIPVLESCVLVGMFVALRLATYWALNYKTTFKRKQE